MAEQTPQVVFIGKRSQGPRVGLGTRIRDAVAFVGKAFGGGSQALGEADSLNAQYEVGGLVRPPFDMDNFADLAERTDALGASIEHIVVNVVGMGHEIIRTSKPRSGSDVTPAEKPDGDTAEVQRERGLMARVFDDLNRRGATFGETSHDTYTDLKALGQGHIEVTRDAQGIIDGLYHLPSREMRLRADKDGHIVGFTQVKGQKKRHFRMFGDDARRFATSAEVEAKSGIPHRKLIAKARPRKVSSKYHVSMKEARFAAKAENNGQAHDLNEVVWFKEYSPRRSDYGAPAATKAFEDIVALANMKLWNSDFFENSTIPPAIILVKGGTLSQNTVNEIKGWMENEGRQEYHRVALLSAPDEETEIDITRLSDVSMSEMGFVEGQEKAQKNIAMVYRVPFSQLTESQRRAPGQAERDDIRMREQVVRPEQRRFCAKINGTVVADLGVKHWEFKLLEGDLTEMTARATAAEKGLRRGALRLNEYRSIVHNLPPMEDGDVAFVIVPGVGVVPMEFIKAMVEEFAKGASTLPELIRLQSSDNGKDGEVAERVRDAAEKAGADLDDEVIEAIAEGIES